MGTQWQNGGSSLCSSRKCPCPPQVRLMEIPRGRGVSKAQFFERKYDSKMIFPEGWGFKLKNLPTPNKNMSVCLSSVGGVWIFSGTTHWNSIPSINTELVERGHEGGGVGVRCRCDGHSLGRLKLCLAQKAY